jgi:hypothetical protein
MGDRDPDEGAEDLLATLLGDGQANLESLLDALGDDDGDGGVV